MRTPRWQQSLSVHRAVWPIQQWARLCGRTCPHVFCVRCAPPRLVKASRARELRRRVFNRPGTAFRCPLCRRRSRWKEVKLEQASSRLQRLRDDTEALLAQAWLAEHSWVLYVPGAVSLRANGKRVARRRIARYDSEGSLFVETGWSFAAEDLRNLCAGGDGLALQVQLAADTQD